jgi:hypothetical protein
MPDPIHDEPPEPLEQATQARLARLASLPVDASGLERRLKAAIAAESGPVKRPASPSHPVLYRFRKPLTALAASVAAAVILGLVILGTQTSPVVAAPADMAALHKEVSDTHAGMAITSIQEANRLITSEWSDTSALPAPPPEHLMSCCVHDLKSRKVACVLLKVGDQPVTLVVARDRDVCCAPGQTTVRRGERTYCVHDADGLRMVMLQQHGRYVCLMGRVPLEALLDIGDQLSF